MATLPLPKKDIHGPSDTNASSHSFHLMLCSTADEIYSLWLPLVHEGLFEFPADANHRFLSISANANQWMAACKNPAFFRNVSFENSCEIALEDKLLLEIDNEDSIIQGADIYEHRKLIRIDCDSFCC